MDKKAVLKDGSDISIRDMTMDDLEKLMQFYTSLPLTDRKYLRIDVTDKAVVNRRIKDAVAKKDIRIAALYQDNIIGTGALELSRESWKKNQGELRVFVASDFRLKGLGLLLTRELYYRAVENNVDKLVVKIMKPQKGARKMVRKIGFRKETVIPGYVTDQSNQTQDLIIMTCSTEDFWRELKHFYTDTDWQRCR